MLTGPEIFWFFFCVVFTPERIASGQDPQDKSLWYFRPKRRLVVVNYQTLARDVVEERPALITFIRTDLQFKWWRARIQRPLDKARGWGCRIKEPNTQTLCQSIYLTQREFVLVFCDRLVPKSRHRHLALNESNRTVTIWPLVGLG